MKFRFGIDTIDHLIAPKERRFGVDSHPFVGCLVGPDGVGKSVVALHAASTYLHDSRTSEPESQKHPIVLYASTDLDHQQANTTWESFGLDYPAARLSALHKLFPHGLDDTSEVHSPDKLPETSPSKKVNLRSIAPHVAREKDQNNSVRNSQENEGTLEEIANPEHWHDTVYFLDLAEKSAGDDWNLINQLFGILNDTTHVKTSEKDSQLNAPHLIIIDAIEGLEAMMGEVDAFGLKRSRRSRLAQLIRMAKKVGSSLLFVVEQPIEGERLPEVFVSDLVLRFRAIQTEGYVNRAVEIEKARGTAHIRGQHDLSIREEKRDKVNPDDEPIQLDDPCVWINDEKGAQREISYVLAIPSLHIKPEHLAARPSQFSKEKIHDPNPTVPNWFGIPDLDDILHPKKSISSSTNIDQSQPPPVDLKDPNERIVVSIGDSGTHKTQLSYSFVAEGFAQNDDSDNDRAAFLLSTDRITRSKLRNEIKEWCLHQRKDKAAEWLANCNNEDFDKRIRVRWLSSHHLTSGQFFFIIRENIRQIKKLHNALGHNPTQFRVVIDNWATILASHPNLARDPQVLQSLLEYLQEEGVLVLIVGTQSGSPHLIHNLKREHDLANLEVRKVFTWPVSFFGGTRVAITTSHSSSLRQPSRILELKQTRRRESNSNHHILDVDRHFGLYKGLESGQPTPIPLRVKLYSGVHVDETSTHHDFSYSSHVSALFGDLFPNPDSSKVVDFQNIENYNAFKEHFRSLDPSRLEETLVFQVDEFWIGDDSNHILAPMKDEYWNAITATKETKEITSPDGKSTIEKWEKGRSIDSENQFLPSAGNYPPNLVQNATRADFFQSDPGVPTPSINDEIYRIPLHSDFGFLLLDRNAWLEACDQTVASPKLDISTLGNDISMSPPFCVDITSNLPLLHTNSESDITVGGFEPIGMDGRLGRYSIHNTNIRRAFRDVYETGKPICVGDVWNALVLKRDKFKNFLKSEDFQPSWELFFQACLLVEKTTKRPAFQVDLCTAETLNSLVLEVWFSSMLNWCVCRQLDNNPKDDKFAKQCEKVLIRQLLHVAGNNNALKPNEEPFTLGQWVEHGYPWLFYTISLLNTVLPKLNQDQNRLVLQQADPNTTAIRSWYAPSVMLQKNNPNLTACRNAGRFSVRGDWFLSFAAGSRSRLLAFSAIDKLTTRRMNLQRLRDGVGLPVRYFESIKHVQTGLQSPVPATNSYRYVQYGELDTLKAEGFENGKPAKSAWLLRSRIHGYSDDSDRFFELLRRVFCDASPNLASDINTPMLHSVFFELSCFKEIANDPKRVAESNLNYYTEEVWHQFMSIASTNSDASVNKPGPDGTEIFENLRKQFVSIVGSESCIVSE